MINGNKTQPPVERGLRWRLKMNKTDGKKHCRVSYSKAGVDPALKQVEAGFAGDILCNTKLVQQAFAFRYMAKVARGKKLSQLPGKLHGKAVDQD